MQGTCRITLFFSAALAVAQAQSPAQQALVNRYCAGCHNDKQKSGGFSFSKLDLAHPELNSDQAERVIRKVRAGMMPPIGLPRPEANGLSNFAVSLETALDTAAAAHPNPGRPALHRLNRTEYRNSIRDLLNVDIDPATLLPPDDMSHGFDNMADVLTISPALMEGYIRAAGRIASEAVGDPSMTATMVTWKIPRVISQNEHIEGTPMGTRGGHAVLHNFPADAEYNFRVTFYYSLDGPLYGRVQAKEQKVEFSVDGERVALLDIDPAMVLTDDIRTPNITVKAGPHRIAAAFIQKFDGMVEDVVSPPGLSLVDLNIAQYPGLTPLPHLHDLSISGPFKPTGVSETPSRARIFTCRPKSGADELSCGKKIIATLARQAYRRPVSDADVEDLLTFYQRARNGKDFESGIRTAIQAMISSPEFVFRFERTPAAVSGGSNHRVADLELASRLSYFLWSSAPDNELISLAAQNRLKDPGVLEAQVRRMLADPKAWALTANFASQWLHLQNLRDAQPDAYLYPNFNRNLADSMRRETEFFFASVIREDRNVLDLLTANYTYVDETLAKHYGIPGVLGTRFRRVEIPDRNRRGLLGQAGILTLTSVSNRTSPVQRGKYVLEVLFGVPPPTPPPNVPPLKENSGEAKAMSVRQRLEQHRENEPCRSCHATIDPLGFSLENYDPTGAWRTRDAGFAIDPQGKLFDGSELNGPAGLRAALLNHTDSFLGTFGESLLAYGLGRVIDNTDMPAVRAIRREAAKNDNRFSTWVMAIVKSTPFQMRRAETESASAASGMAPTPLLPSLRVPLPNLHAQLRSRDREGAVVRNNAGRHHGPEETLH